MAAAGLQGTPERVDQILGEFSRAIRKNPEHLGVIEEALETLSRDFCWQLTPHERGNEGRIGIYNNLAGNCGVDKIEGVKTALFMPVGDCPDVDKVLKKVEEFKDTSSIAVSLVVLEHVEKGGQSMFKNKEHPRSALFDELLTWTPGERRIFKSELLKKQSRV